MGLQSNPLPPEQHHYPHLDVEVNTGDLHCLADILFKKLDSRFQHFFSYLRDGKSGADMCAGAFEELILLLRCCLVILNLLAYDQNLLLGKGRVLLLILKALISSNVREGESEKRSCSVSFEKMVSRECEYVDGDNGCSTSVAEHFAASLHFLEPSDPYRPFLCSLLEVIVSNFQLFDFFSYIICFHIC